LIDNGQPIAAIPIEHYRLVINPTLPSIPLFTLAGYLLSEGGASKRLVRVFQAFFGRFRGGAAVAAVLVCSFFTSFTSFNDDDCTKSPDVSQYTGKFLKRWPTNYTN
jgi:TRAP-type mannitol/chloroaromatic compound transport system permease large subunit